MPLRRSPTARRTWRWWSRKNSGVASIAGLKGKRIGVSTAGSLTDWLARNIAVSQKWRPADIEIVPLGEMRTRLAAMRGGELAAAVTSVQEAYQIQDNGLGTVLATFGEVVPNFHTHVVYRARWVDPKRARPGSGVPQSVVHRRGLYA